MTLRRLDAHGLSVPLLAGWDIRILQRKEPAVMWDGMNPTPTGGWVYPMIHAATIPMPPLGGDYGSHVVPLLGPSDIFMAMVEFAPEEAGTALFTPGMPVLRGAQFNRDAMQRVMPGMSGAQQFFTIQGRAFSLLCVVGSHLRRNRLAATAQTLFSKIEVEPR